MLCEWGKLEMKILYVITSFGGGGAESQLFSFAKCIKKYEEVECKLCALKKGGEFETKIKKEGISYTIFGTSSIVKNILKLHQELKNGRYDIVHAHMLYSDVVCRFASIGTKVKVVSTHHGLGRWKKKWLIALDKLTKNRVDHFIMVSDKSYEIRLSREKYPSSKMTVIYNGISSDFIAEKNRILSKDKIVLGCVARFTENKQMHYLIEVLRELKKQYNNVFVEFVGQGETENYVKELTNRYNLDECVTFHGWSDDVKSIISQWNFFLLCSTNEDFPVSLLEAMGSGIVPVASNVGGIPKILDNGRLGSLCNSRDYHSFTEGVKRYIIDVDKYNETSKECIENIKNNFSIEKNVERYLQIYRNVLEA